MRSARRCSTRPRPPRCWPEPEGEAPAPRLAPAIAPRPGSADAASARLRDPRSACSCSVAGSRRRSTPRSIWRRPATIPVKASDVLDRPRHRQHRDRAGHRRGAGRGRRRSRRQPGRPVRPQRDPRRRRAPRRRRRGRQGSVLDTGRDFLRGAVIGDVGGGTGLAGAFAGDLVGIGDVRDLGREGWRIANGEEPDRLVMGLAAAGLAVTAATWISVGEAAPIRGGLTIVKALRKAGRLSAGMTDSVGRLLRRSVDVAGLRRATGSLAHLDVAAARQAAADAIRPGMHRTAGGPGPRHLDPVPARRRQGGGGCGRARPLAGRTRPGGALVRGHGTGDPRRAEDFGPQRHRSRRRPRRDRRMDYRRRPLGPRDCARRGTLRSAPRGNEASRTKAARAQPNQD